MPPCARVSAAQPPAGPPPITAATPSQNVKHVSDSKIFTGTRVSVWVSTTLLSLTCNAELPALNRLAVCTCDHAQATHSRRLGSCVHISRKNASIAQERRASGIRRHAKAIECLQSRSLSTESSAGGDGLGLSNGAGKLCGDSDGVRLEGESHWCFCENKFLANKISTCECAVGSTKAI